MAILGYLTPVVTSFGSSMQEISTISGRLGVMITSNGKTRGSGNGAVTARRHWVYFHARARLSQPIARTTEKRTLWSL
jgi:hypothetical protein